MAPGDPCPACGGDLTERALQYPAIASTAYECADCGQVAFDTLSIPTGDLYPKDRRENAVGPDVAAYREKHDVDPGEWEE